MYLLNKFPTKIVSTTSYEIWKGRKPNLKHVKVWGCHPYIKRLLTYKLKARSEKCRFIGYPKETMLNKRPQKLKKGDELSFKICD